MSSAASNASPVAALPIIVPVGFAGSRHLLPAGSTLDEAARQHFHAALEAQLRARLVALRAELGLGPAHVLCGVSQVAIGADMLFTRACRDLQLPQRVFLPQSRDEYLSALEGTEAPDFEQRQRQEAEQLLASPHVIEERVVSDAAQRNERFTDANLEIIRVSEVFMCVLRADAATYAGGTVEFLAKARKRGHPVLELRVHEEGGLPVLNELRHNWPDHAAGTGWKPPQLPPELGTRRIARALAGSTGVDVFQHAERTLAQLARIGDDESVQQRRLFRYAALIIITAHLLATACAVVLTLTHLPSPGYGLLLAAEFGLLAIGVGTHLWLHHARAAKSWATYRLTAELAIGVQAVRNVRVSLEHLFTLPFPATLTPLLRTMYVLHLVISRRNAVPWEEARNLYMAERLEGPRGQIAYYQRELGRAARWLRLANRCFITVTSIALATTPVKLWLVPWLFGSAPVVESSAAMAASVVSILFPMVAVAALSLAASFDLEARVHTYEEALTDLRALREGVLQADSAREFAQLAVRAERELLAETANWASRRSFTSVT